MQRQLREIQLPECRPRDERRQGPREAAVLLRAFLRIGLCPVRFQFANQRGHHLEEQGAWLAPEQGFDAHSAAGSVACARKQSLQVPLKSAPYGALFQEATQEFNAGALRIADARGGAQVCEWSSFAHLQSQPVDKEVNGLLAQDVLVADGEEDGVDLRTEQSLHVVEHVAVGAVVRKDNDGPGAHTFTPAGASLALDEGSHG